MKNILIPILLTYSCATYASDGDTVDIYAYGLSYHTNRDYNFREVNPGIGIGYSAYDESAPILSMTLQISCYKNSYAEWTGLTTFGPRLTFGDRSKFHYGADATLGVIYSESIKGSVAFPSFFVGYDRFNLHTVYIANAGGSGNSTAKNPGSDSAAFALVARYSF